MNETSQLSQSVYFVTTKVVKNNFQAKAFVRLCCCSCYCLSRILLLENWMPWTLCVSVWPKKFSHLNPAIVTHWSNLSQEIQIPGGSNLMHAYSNHICKWLYCDTQHTAHTNAVSERSTQGECSQTWALVLHLTRSCPMSSNISQSHAAQSHK